MAAQSNGRHSDNVPTTNESALESGYVSSVLPSTEPATAAEVLPRYRTTIVVNRPVYTQSDFKEKYQFTAIDNPKVSERLHDTVHRHCAPSGSCVVKFLLSLFPFIGIMKQYSIRRDLLSDIIAGLTVGIMHIPQGLYSCVLQGPSF